MLYSKLLDFEFALTLSVLAMVSKVSVCETRTKELNVHCFYNFFFFCSYYNKMMIIFKYDAMEEEINQDEKGGGKSVSLVSTVYLRNYLHFSVKSNVLDQLKL